MKRFTLLSVLLCGLCAYNTVGAESLRYAIAMHGEPKYPASFTHFDYANPDAPKGGEVRLADVSPGGFDSLNPFIIKGVHAPGISSIYDTLTVQSDDEAFTVYGLIAEKIEMPDDRSWVSFHINPKAVFHDGQPITADDVVFTFNKLLKEGHPQYEAMYNGVDKVKAIDKLTVKFTFKPGDNRELPLILGNLPVLPKHYWEKREFTRDTEIPLGNGPYKIESVTPGRDIVYTRVKDYWAKDLPVNKGRYNFDKIRYTSYRDDTVALEAFKAGNYDFRAERSSKLWATAYTGAQFDKKLIIKEQIHNENPAGMQAFVMNTREYPFNNPLVRQAINYAFDFEWTNKQLMYGAYTRSNSYFSNSELASTGLPSPAELEILKPFKDKLPPELFTQPFTLPTTDGSGNNRPNLKVALDLLNKAGFEIKENMLVSKSDGKPLAFEILLVDPAFTRLIQPFIQNLEKIGIKASIRQIDDQQYVDRLNKFDFQMIVDGFGESLSPGNEQRGYWHSSQADIEGSQNYIGIKNEVIDALVEQIIAAPDRTELINRTRALDRVLLWNYFVIPNWHYPYYRIAYWNKFNRPAITPKYALGFLDTWWIDNAKAAGFLPEISPPPSTSGASAETTSSQVTSIPASTLTTTP